MSPHNPSTKPSTGKPGIAARRAAVRLLTEVTENKRLLSELLPVAVAGLDPSDRARAQRLAIGALRDAGKADRLLGPFLRQKPYDVVPNTLRLAIWEMFSDGASPHGVVDCAVSIARSEAPRAAGLVNAVLRNVLRADSDWASLPPSSLPKWLRKRLVADYGKDVVAHIELAHSTEPPLDLTPKSGAAERVAKAVGGDILPTGSVRVRGRPQVSALAGFETGDWWVQDAAAALPARMLDAKPGERVLDLCAAPGGKTMQLADVGATVTALDISDARLDKLRDNLGRTGLSADIVVGDGLTWSADELFDAILLDAPCSATGTMRRHPDLAHAKSGLDLDALLDLQSRLLDRAIDLLRPGGRVVYCTCSLLHAEGEAKLAAALDRHPDLRVLPIDLPGVEKDWITEQGGLRLRPDFWPDLGGMDGFFSAALQKPA